MEWKKPRMTSKRIEGRLALYLYPSPTDVTSCEACFKPIRKEHQRLTIVMQKGAVGSRTYFCEECVLRMANRVKVEREARAEVA
jgi:hypothetical protein